MIWGVVGPKKRSDQDPGTVLPAFLSKDFFGNGGSNYGDYADPNFGDGLIRVTMKGLKV